MTISHCSESVDEVDRFSGPVSKTKLDRRRAPSPIGPCHDIELPKVLEGLAEPAAVIDTDYKLIAANRAYQTRFSEGEPVCGRHCYEVSHHRSVPCDQEGEACPLRGAVRTGRRCRALHIHQTCMGGDYEAVTIHPLFGDDGRVSCFLELLSPFKEFDQPDDDHPLVGQSPPFQHMLDLVARVAPTATTSVLLGESGTGKELVARALHAQSPRALKSFVPVDCSGLTDSLFESELFGHEKGAFTGAYGRKKGLVEAADGGTLFLDEVGDIPLGLQVKLLRLLETGMFRRVGSVEQRHSDFRLVCATHRDLQKRVEEGSFRRDLYYRISVFPIALPPLRSRIGDLPLLIDSLLERMGCRCFARISPETFRALEAYPFPGNVRELQNLLERACLLADTDTLLPRHLPEECLRGHASYLPARPDDELLSLEELEARYLQWAAASYPGDRSSLAQKLGLSERTLYRKLHRAREGSGNGSNGNGSGEDGSFKISKEH